MNPVTVLGIILIYFGILVVIARVTGKNTTTQGFFNADKNNAWYLVAFGMIGTSLSGATFISVPGQVGTSGFTYFQMALGYLAGYLVIGTILMPLYYRLNLVSIYTYLEQRFGFWSYKTGAAFFLISRTIGSSARFFIVVSVLQMALFDQLGIPVGITATVALILIWVYTYKGGIKTIVYTDTLQTFFMLASLVLSFFLISHALELSAPQLLTDILNSEKSQLFVWDYDKDNYFWKQFLAGAFITIVMTGLDQDLMQKNLSCKSLKEAQKNMFWFSITLLVVNFLFLALGAALYIFAEKEGIPLPSQSDKLYPMLALNHFSPLAGTVFILGIIAASYASTDSALTALTTSFCIDFLGIDKMESEKQKQKTKTLTHLGLTLLMLIAVLAFSKWADDAMIRIIFKIAGYTYGPLLGLFAFGVLTKRLVIDKWIPVICFLSPIISFVLASNSVAWLNGYKFGFEILLVNGLITFLGMYSISSKPRLTV